MVIAKFLCKIFGHNYYMIFSNVYVWDYNKWVEHSTVHKCSRCNHIEEETYQKGI